MNDKLAHALRRIYNRPDPPPLWQGGGNLPWNDPDFSARMLREHLDEGHGAATRQAAERAAQREVEHDDRRHREHHHDADRLARSPLDAQVFPYHGPYGRPKFFHSEESTDFTDF